jgi:hypothetical protein
MRKRDWFMLFSVFALIIFGIIQGMPTVIETLQDLF